jgi:hypothetical protein
MFAPKSPDEEAAVCGSEEAGAGFWEEASAPGLFSKDTESLLWPCAPAASSPLPKIFSLGSCLLSSSICLFISEALNSLVSRLALSCVERAWAFYTYH